MLILLGNFSMFHACRVRQRIHKLASVHRDIGELLFSRETGLRRRSWVGFCGPLCIGHVHRDMAPHDQVRSQTSLDRHVR